MFTKTATANENATIIRNYIILTTTVMFMSMSLVDTFMTPSRVSQQSRLDDYGRVMSAGLVAYSQKLGR